jgi:hypothetical protein
VLTGPSSKSVFPGQDKLKIKSNVTFRFSARL